MMVNNTRTITAYGDGIHHAVQDKPAIFMINTNDMQGDLKVRIDGKKKKNLLNKILFLYLTRS